MLYSILIILYLVLFAGLAWKKMNWAIYAIVFGLPSYLIRFNVGPLPMTVLEGMILVVFGIWGVKKLRNEEIKKLRELNFKKLKSSIEKWRGLLGPMILFLLAASVAVLVAEETRAAMGLWKAYFVEPLLFFAVFISVIKKGELKNIFCALAASSAVVSLVAIYQKITGNWIANEFWAAEATRRVSGAFPYPNALALYLGPIIILLIGFGVMTIGNIKRKIGGKDKEEIEKLRNKEIGKAVGLLLVIVIGLLSVWWSGSKGATMGVVAGLIFYAIFYRGYRKYFVPLVTIIFLVGAFLLQGGRINLKGNYSVEGGDSLTVRQEMWVESWQMIKEHWVLGAGLGGYQEVMKEYHSKRYIEIYLYPHNIFLNFWSELGLLGLLAFLWILFWYYRRGFTKQNKKLRFTSRADNIDLRVLLAAAMTTLAVHGLVDVPYFKNDLSVFFWLILGMMVVDQIGQKGKQGL